MAQVQFFKFDADGFPVEHVSAADDFSALSLTAGAGGISTSGNVVMGSNKITGLADGTASGDAVNKGQLDSLAAGFDRKQSCRVKPTADLSGFTAAGVGVGATLTAPSTATSHNTQDGVLLSVNDRVLVSTAADAADSPDADNGIYYVSLLGDAGSNSFTLTRATDADQDAEVTAGMFTFVTEGTANGDTGWFVTTNDPITVDTTALAWSQFAGVGAFTGGDGIDITSGVISVDLATDPGLEFSTAKLRVLVDPAGAIARVAAGLGIKLEASNPSLQISSNELGIKFNSSGGLEKLAAGTGIKLNGTTLALAASGISVLGVPAAGTWEIGGVATSANVTAANLSELTGGGSTTLHSHAGAAEAERIETAYTSDGTGHSIGDPVFVSANNVSSSCNANNNNTRKFIGIAKTTVGATTSVDIVSAGVLAGCLSGATAGDIYYLAVGGGLTATRPVASGDHSLVVGKAKNATDLHIMPQYLGKKA